LLEEVRREERMEILSEPSKVVFSDAA